jgi:hypothetical protein
MSNGNGNGFYVVEDPKSLIEAGKGKIVEKYVIILSFDNRRYYHKYQTPEPSFRGGYFGFKCYDYQASIPECPEERKRKVLGWVQDRPGHTLWQIQICDMGGDSYRNYLGDSELPIVVDNHNKILSCYEPRSRKFVGIGNSIFKPHPLTEFIFHNLLIHDDHVQNKNGYSQVWNVAGKKNYSRR